MSMTLSQFLDSLEDFVPPPGLEPALEALWWAGGKDLALAHEIVQRHEGEPDCDWVHAWLHRKEGDQANARYWYRRASRSARHGPVEEEWRAIATTLLAGSGY